MADREMAAGGADEPKRGATDRAKEKAKDVKDQAKEKLSSAADRGEEMMDDGMEKARELGDRASEMARSRADEQRERVVGGMRTVADAIRRSSRELPEDRQQYGRLLDGVANRVDGASRYLEEHDVDALTRDARRMARDHAPAFLTGAFALGMIGARVLKSSGEQGRAGRTGGNTLPSTGYAGQLRGEVGDGYGVEEGYSAGGHGRSELYGASSPRAAGYDESTRSDAHMDRGAVGPDYDELQQGVDRGADDVGADWDEGLEERGNG